MILFADDSNLFIKGLDLNEMTNILNDELTILIDWLKANKLSLNILKTNYMIFGPNKKTRPPDQQIMINDIQIERVKEAKFLGIIIEENLCWKNHMKHISLKLAKSIGILNMARKIFDKRTLINLYYAFIYPLLLYGNTIWGNAPTSTLWPVFKLQKIALRIINNAHKRERPNNLCISSNILKLQDLYELTVGSLMQKIVT